MKKQLTNLLAILVTLLPAAYLAIIWNSLPQQVALHFNAQLEPERYGDKLQLWLLTIGLAVVSMAVYFLLKNINRIDPKRKNREPGSAFEKLALGIVVFIAAMNVLVISSTKNIYSFKNWILPLIGLLFAFLGNYMITIKPNYFAGFRLPWTLSDDTNWRKTHQLGGRLWFAGGILIAVVCFFLPLIAGFVFFISIMMVLVVIPIVYSYRLYKRQAL